MPCLSHGTRPRINPKQDGKREDVGKSTHQDSRSVEEDGNVGSGDGIGTIKNFVGERLKLSLGAHFADISIIYAHALEVIGENYG